MVCIFLPLFTDETFTYSIRNVEVVGRVTHKESPSKGGLYDGSGRGVETEGNNSTLVVLRLQRRVSPPNT